LRDEEFRPQSGALIATNNSAANNKFDLLSALIQELALVVQFAEGSAILGNLPDRSLALSLRILPSNQLLQSQNIATQSNFTTTTSKPKPSASLTAQGLLLDSSLNSLLISSANQ
jgi:hypothetical protein